MLLSRAPYSAVALFSASAQTRTDIGGTHERHEQQYCWHAHIQPAVHQRSNRGRAARGSPHFIV
jgi:hypothetical protein